MPNICLHLLLADRALDRWKRDPHHAPFDVGNPDLANHFRHGAVAPDVGYLVGAHRQFSELAHLRATGDLARHLTVTARSATERAYAWGWVTHVLADLAIHPLINRVAHEIRGTHSDGSGPAHPGDIAHMRVEYGLDAYCFHHFRRNATFRLYGEPDLCVVRFVCVAFQHVHHITVQPGSLIGGHRAAVRALRCATVLNRILTASLRRDPVPAVARRGIALAAHVQRALRYPRSPLVHAVLHSVPPPAALIREVQQVLEGFATVVLEHRAADLAGLANFNLKTGEPEEPESPGAAAHRTGQVPPLAPGGERA